MRLVHAPGDHRVHAKLSVTVQPNAPKHGISFRGYSYPARQIDGQWVVDLPDHVPMKMADGTERIVPLTDAELDQLAAHGLVPAQYVAAQSVVESAVQQAAGTIDMKEIFAQEAAARAAMAESKAAEAPAEPKAAPAPAKKKPGDL